MKPILLWSDLLVWLLVFGLLAFFVVLHHDTQVRKKWLVVFQSRAGSFAFIIMLFYILVALLDSMHFRRALPAEPASEGVHQQIHYSAEVESVLDIILHDLKSSTEKTYSAPFAIYSLAKENQRDADGRLYRDYPRLQHAGVHLADPAERNRDIALRSLAALGAGIAWALLVVSILHFLRKRLLPTTVLPWVMIHGTMATLIVLSYWVLELGAFYHILGTDKVGTDVLYQSIKSIRTGVLIGSLATLLTLPFAICFGIAAGYFKGWVDDVIQYIYTTLSSIPDILLIAAAVLVLDFYIEANAASFELMAERADFKFLTLCFILGVTSWTGLCRLLRAETLKVSELDFVQAARAFGVSHLRILFRHILPNVMHLVLISIVLNFSTFVLAESVLSYIGVGVDASMTSWGGMINAARQELSRDPTVWWSIVAAFLLMFVLVLSANLFADKVRDAFDPRHTSPYSGGTA